MVVLGSVDGGTRGGGGGVCSSSARTDAPVSVARVESSRVDGWDERERERIANARRRGASTSRDAVPERESD